MRLKVSSAKWPFCLGRNVLRVYIHFHQSISLQWLQEPKHWNFVVIYVTLWHLIYVEVFLPRNHIRAQTCVQYHIICKNMLLSLWYCKWVVMDFSKICDVSDIRNLHPRVWNIHFNNLIWYMHFGARQQSPSIGRDYVYMLYYISL